MIDDLIKELMKIKEQTGSNLPVMVEVDGKYYDLKDVLYNKSYDICLIKVME